jgi:hypothetical protein
VCTKNFGEAITLNSLYPVGGRNLLRPFCLRLDKSSTTGYESVDKKHTAKML